MNMRKLKYTTGKKLSMALLCIFTLVSAASGCGASPSPSDTTLSEKPMFDSVKYDSFENGMSTFYDNYSEMKAYIMNRFMATDPKTSLDSDEKNDYYDNMLLLMAVIDLELSVLPEYDLLDVIQDYTDRAEGNLLISGYYGYKIKQNSGLKFGCAESDGKTIEGTVDAANNLMKFIVDEKIQSGVSCRTVAEIVINSPDYFVMRCSKSVMDNNPEPSLAKTVYILLKDGSVQLAYFEGNADVSKYVGLDLLIDYNMNALAFGVGTVLNFELEL